MSYLLRTLFGLWLVASGTLAQAHKGSDAYLDVQQVPAQASSTGQRALHWQLALALKDLDQLLPLDANADGRITWGEVKAAVPPVSALLNTAAQLDTDTLSCRLDWRYDGLERRSDGAYLRLAADNHCPLAQPLALRYTLLRQQDAAHRLLVAGRIGGHDLLTTARPQDDSPLLLSPAANSPPAGRWRSVQDYAALGLRHLLEGYDHLAFLLALVLPLPLQLRRHAEPGVWPRLLRTVTAFTLGHSITLLLATFGWAQLAPRWVEPAIALSIAATALLNLYPQPRLRSDVLALGFGLVHGLGFAGLLLEAAAPSGLLPWALLGFNLGIEAGQLLAVSAWVIASQALINRPWYQRRVVQGGSQLLALLAAWWFWQRVV